MFHIYLQLMVVESIKMSLSLSLFVWSHRTLKYPQPLEIQAIWHFWQRKPANCPKSELQYFILLIFSYHLIQFYLTFFCGSLHRHKADADQIEKIAKDANDTSTKAYNMLKKALDGENKTSSDIDELNKKYVMDITFYATVLSILCHLILRKHFKCRWSKMLFKCAQIRGSKGSSQEPGETGC